MESGAFISSAELIQKSATRGLYGLNFHSATLLLMLAVEIVIRITDSAWDMAESL